MGRGDDWDLSGGRGFGGGDEGVGECLVPRGEEEGAAGGVEATVEEGVGVLGGERDWAAVRRLAEPLRKRVEDQGERFVGLLGGDDEGERPRRRVCGSRRRSGWRRRGERGGIPFALAEPVAHVVVEKTVGHNVRLVREGISFCEERERVEQGDQAVVPEAEAGECGWQAGEGETLLCRCKFADMLEADSEMGPAAGGEGPVEQTGTGCAR